MNKLIFEGLDNRPPQGNASGGDVLEGKTFQSASTFSVQTGQMQDFTGATIPTSYQNPSGADSFNVKVPPGYFPGDEYNLSVGDPNLVPANIKNGTTVFGVLGTAEVSSGSASYEEISTNGNISDLGGGVYQLTASVQVDGLKPKMAAVSISFITDDAKWSIEEGTQTMNLSDLLYTSLRNLADNTSHDDQYRITILANSISPKVEQFSYDGSNISVTVSFTCTGSSTVTWTNASQDIWIKAIMSD